MEVIRPYLDSLPKISYQTLEKEWEEGDRLYMITGYSRDIGRIDICKVAKGSWSGLSNFLQNPMTSKFEELPTCLTLVEYNLGTALKELLAKLNRKRDLSLARDEREKKSLVLAGDIEERYVLVRRDERRYEVVT